MDARIKKGAAGAVGIAVFAMVGALLLMEEPQKSAPKQRAEVERSPYQSKIVPVEEVKPIAKTAAVTTEIKTSTQEPKQVPPPKADLVTDKAVRKKNIAALKLEESTSIKTVKNNSSRVEAVVPKTTALRLKKSTSVASIGSLHKAWAIQLGSFSNNKNASNLKDKLQGAGFNSFVATKEMDGHTTTRVYVGPEKTRQDAKKVLLQLQKRQKMEGVIVGYDG
ncbi:MAG: SPOR domain-containing protein [Candidatus Polarisedimenticolaceae bacterium]|nr:SPOR domain-containing protein [Candidatus Polarisedimenticolaceae bacterium]